MSCIRCGRRVAFPGLVVCAACAEELVGQIGRAKFVAGAAAVAAIGYVALVIVLSGGPVPR